MTLEERVRALIAEMQEEVDDQKVIKGKNEAEIGRLIGWEDALKLARQHLDPEAPQ